MTLHSPSNILKTFSTASATRTSTTTCPVSIFPTSVTPTSSNNSEHLEIIFVVGEKDIFVENNLALSNALWSKNIWNALHLWDGESHKARYWRHMVQLYL